jgi:hypothetical protein
MPYENIFLSAINYLIISALMTYSIINTIYNLLMKGIVIVSEEMKILQITNCTIDS